MKKAKQYSDVFPYGTSMDDVNSLNKKNCEICKDYPEEYWCGKEELKSIEDQTIDNFMLGVLDFLKRHKLKSINRPILDSYVSIEYRKLSGAGEC